MILANLFSSFQVSIMLELCTVVCCRIFLPFRSHCRDLNGETSVTHWIHC